MRYFGILFVVVIGALTTVEAGANAKLSRGWHEPWWPGVVFGAGVLVVLVGCALAAWWFAGVQPPRWSQLGQVPWWAWAGGPIAALYGVSMLIFPDKLGSATFTGLTVTAAVLASVLLDHMGWLGFKEHPAGFGRLAGTVLMVAGLALVAMF